MRSARQLVLVLLLALNVTAQQATEEKDSPKGTVEGFVYRPDGRPLKYAKVRVWPHGDITCPDGEITDAAGHFVLEVSPGRYRVLAEHSGYAPAMYGARTPNGIGRAVVVGPGERVAGIDVRLAPAPVVIGRASDQDGEPLAGVNIVAYAAYREPRYAIQGPTSTAVTDSSGRFRLDNLAPGRYYLGAKANADALPSPKAGAGPAIMYSAVWYPGVTDSTQAAPLELRSGDEFRADFILAPVPAFRVRGHVLRPDSLSHGVVALFPRDTRFGTESGDQARLDPDGSFEFPLVLPGAYTLYAHVSGDEDGWSVGSIPVEVTGDLTVDVATVPPAQLFCRVISDSLPPASPVNGPWVTIHLESPDGTLSRRAYMSEEEPGTFEVGVPAGTFRLWAEGTGEGTYLQAARLNGLDALDRDVSLDGGGSLELVFARGAGTVSGVVRDRDGNPVPAAVVELVPAGSRESLSTLHVADTSDKQGRFILHNIVPGDYRIFAHDADMFEAETLLFGDGFDRSSIRPYEDRAKSIRVAPNASAFAELLLLSPR